MSIEKFSEVHRSAYGISKICHKYGFVVFNWLPTIIAATQAFFQLANFWKMSKICAHCKINHNLLLDVELCLKPYRWVTPSTQEKKFWFYLYLLWNYSSNKVKRVNSSIASLAATQTMWYFLTSWCQELSDGILHARFCSDNFQSPLYLKQDINKLKEGIQLISSGGLCHCERLLQLVLSSLHFPLFTFDFLFLMVHYEKHVKRYDYCCQ